MYYYERKPVDDNEVINKLTALAERYPRYGFHKLFVVIRREGHLWNHKRVPDYVLNAAKPFPFVYNKCCWFKWR